MANKKAKKGSLKISIIVINSISILLLGVVISLFSYGKFTETVYTEVEDGLRNIAYTITNTYDKVYPGDYTVRKTDSLMALYKGSKHLGQEFIECISEDTNTEISVFAGDIRMISTLSNDDGTSLVGTSANYAIQKDVLGNDEDGFYSKVYVNGKRYFAYYMPLHNADGSVAGMIAIAKPATQVNRLIAQSVMPIFIIAIIGMVAAGLFTLSFFNKIINVFNKIKVFLQEVEKGNLDTHIDQPILKRNDELGEMATAAGDMQRSIKQLVETDALTGLYNRRFANSRIEYIWNRADESGMSFALSIGDIDFFKYVNDTYGHDAGDKVLMEISGLMKKVMAGKGFAARWGGEEFLLVFERMDATAAEELLNDFIKQIKDMEVIYNEQTIHITMSFGVTNGYGRPLETVLKCADDRLYYAKTQGRDRVVCTIEE